jgi:hypothetical protein
LITLFAIPKPFHGHIGVIQRNALGSWAQIANADVILLGDDDGVGEAASDFGFGHEPEIRRTEHGTPLVSDAFRLARAGSRHSLLGYVNADVVLLPDFARAVARIRKSRFLLAGQRWNTAISDPIDFADPDWEARVRDTIIDSGTLAGPDWLDYFVMPRDSALIDDLPDFAVGRPGWDSWLVWRARHTRTPLIDATSAITAVHQAHGYAHVPGGTWDPEGMGEVWFGPELKVNRELQAGAWLSVDYATHVMTSRRPVPALGYKHLRRRWQTRYDFDGGIERLGRFLEPVLVPAGRARRRVFGFLKRS